MNNTRKKTVKLSKYIHYFIYKSKHVGRYSNLHGVKMVLKYYLYFRGWEMVG